MDHFIRKLIDFVVTDQEAASRTRALRRLGPPRQRYGRALPA
jgi:hypothetical protein